MSCPNSTESGCRCAEHHPGLGLAAPVVLHVVTRGPSGPSTDAVLDSHLQKLRAGCAACGGNRERCMAGNGPNVAPAFGRLKGCKAYDDAGEQRPLKARAQPRQPWEPRAA